jgi:hypothetical protein
MKNMIEARSDCLKIKKNPIFFFQGIKEHVLNDQEIRYNMPIIVDSISTMMNTKQLENESLQKYAERFRVASNVLKSQSGGPLILTKNVEMMSK